MTIPFGVSLKGTAFDDQLLVDFATVDAMYIDHGWGAVEAWNRHVVGYAGDDYITRDRPGDYKADAVYQIDGQEYSLGGDVVIFGSDGHGSDDEDTVDYSLWTGGIDVDLDAYGAQLFGELVGFARNLGIAGTTVYGEDRLISIENIVGTEQRDVIHGSIVDNKLWGLGGDDDIFGEEGDDDIRGGWGEDYLSGGIGTDEIHGDQNADNIFGGDQTDWLYGDSGADNLHGDAGSDWMYGGTENDDMWGGADGDFMFGGAHNDEIWGEDGNDFLNGETGADHLYGGNDDDTIWGGGQNDTIRGQSGVDKAYGQDGNDWIYVDADDLVADGGNGIDRVYQTDTSGFAWEVWVHAFGNGTMVGGGGLFEIDIESVEQFVMGDSFDDLDLNGSVANKVWLNGGNDEADLGAGNDYAYGGDDNDVLRGQSGDDHLYGEEGNDELVGGSGDDRIEGGTGMDVIRGGQDADELWGGAQSDTFVWKDGDDGIDYLKDFVLGEDVIDIDDYLANAPQGVTPDYTGHVAAWPTAWNGTTALYALTDDGWTAFAYIEGYSQQAIADAIDSGVLFGVEQASGSGRPLDFVQDLHGGADIHPAFDFLL